MRSFMYAHTGFLMTTLQTDVHRHQWNHLSMLWVSSAVITAFGTGALNLSLTFILDNDTYTDDDKKRS